MNMVRVLKMITWCIEDWTYMPKFCKWQFHIISWKKILYLFYSNFTEVGSLDPIDDKSVIV